VPQSRDTSYVRVVVVEDDRLLRAVLATYCRSIGMQVVAEIPDGQAALELLSDESRDCSDQPDLILTDCQMPRMDGIALVRHLRARGDETPVIMLSGQQDARVADIALAAGVNCFLPKPLSTESLQDALAQTFPGWAA
jgi:CheY-like chemotaxis protein